MRCTADITFVVTLIVSFFNLNSLTPILNDREAHSFHTRLYITKSADQVEPEISKKDLIAWLNGHTVQIGNVSEEDLKAIVNSLKQVIRPESARFPRVKVYNYRFKQNQNIEDADDKNDPESVVRELLVYIDPEEDKQWIVNIEDLDLRQNVIIFRIGDLGFGFSKEDTYVVLRKTMSKSDTFHYFHLAYLTPRKKGKGMKNVEWDNIRPKDLLPIPFTFKESKDAHGKHCNSRECGLTEVIFGLCAITKLSCMDLKDVRLYGPHKERMQALIREKQPFLFELAKSLSIHKRYLKSEDKPRVKRFTGAHHAVENSFHHEISINHHSVKKDNAAAASNIQDAEAMQASYVVVEKESLSGDTEKNSDTAAKAPAMNKHVKSGDDHGLPNENDDSGETPTKRIVRNDKGYNFTDDSKEASSSVNDDDSSSSSSGIQNESRIQKPSDNEPIVAAYQSDKKIPSSIDNLQVGKTEEESEEQSEGYFEKMLDKIRSSPPVKYTVRPLECVGCESMGTFFSEYEESSMIYYIVNNIVHDVFTNMTSLVFSPEAQEVLEGHPTVPYVGYGTCQYSIQMISRSPKSTEMDDLIEYYSEALGVNCEEKDCDSQRSKTIMRELLTSKYHFLEIWPDMSIRLNKSSQLPKSQIMSTHEFKQFMVSLIFSAFTNEYHLKILSRSDLDANSNKSQANNQSIRMRFQTRIILRVLDELIKSFPQHLIKGARYLLQVLEDKYLALVAEHMSIVKFEFKGNEDERNQFKVMNRNDRIQSLALKDFIINGVASINKSGTGSLSAFTTFYNHNQERISRFLVEFGADRRRSGNSLNSNLRRSADEDYATELLKKVLTADTRGSRRDQPSRVLVELDDVRDIVAS